MVEDYQIHSARKTISGRDALRQWVSDFQTVLTNARIDILDVFADAAGDRVVSRWMCSASITEYSGFSLTADQSSSWGIAICA